MTLEEGLGQIGGGCWICEAQTRCITLELDMMDCFHQQAAGDVVLSPRCAVFLQVQAAGEMEDIFQSRKSQQRSRDTH